jgi:two-component system NtrC family sensor kinase
VKPATDCWILRATIDSDIFNRLVRSAQVGTAGDAYIVNREGMFQDPAPLRGSFWAIGHRHPAIRGRHHRSSKRKIPGSDTRYIGGSWLKDNEWMLVISQIAGQERRLAGQVRNTEILIIATGCLIICSPSC